MSIVYRAIVSYGPNCQGIHHSIRWDICSPTSCRLISSITLNAILLYISVRILWPKTISESIDELKKDVIKLF